MDKLVLDVETKNTFQEVGGQWNVKGLDVSFVGVYSYNQNKYLGFFEEKFEELGTLLQKAGLVVGFSLNRFDMPVLEKYFKFNVSALPTLDLLEEIELAYGARVSLNVLAQANLGMQKTQAHGLEAIRLWNEKKLKELEEYCLQDVRITKELYELIKRQKYVTIPQKFTGAPQKVPIVLNDLAMPSTLF